MQHSTKVSALAEITLWGIHGVHSKHDFPVNNSETAAMKTDPGT